MPDTIGSDVAKATYWAAQDDLELAKEAYKRVRRYYADLPNTTMFKRWAKAYRVYYGLAGEEDPFDIYSAMQTGDQGQLVGIKMNHAGSVGRRAVALVSQTVPDFDIIPENSDSASQEQADFGRKLLDYYMDTAGVGAYLFEAAEGAFIFGESTFSAMWDPLAGPPLPQPDPAMPSRTKAGDLVFRVLTPLDMVVDRFRYDRDHEWKIERSFLSKWNIAARYAGVNGQKNKALYDKIVSLDSRTKDNFPGVITNSLDSERQRKNDDISDLIPVYTLMHKKTDALPEGRIATFLSEDILLYAAPLPYEDIPHATIAPGKIIRTPFGDSMLHHVLGLQDIIDNVVSAIASNNIALATHIIMVPKNSEYDYKELAEGLAALECDTGPDGKHKPEVLSLNASNEVAERFVEFAIKAVETIGGIPATLRGNPQPNIQSGAFGALVAQQALEYAGPFQYSFQQAVGKAGNIIIDILQQFANEPRVVEIAGEDHAYQVKSFTKKDIVKIHRVAVKSGNPAARTPAFAVAAADSLLQRGALGSPDVAAKRYLQLIRTGDLDTVISGVEATTMRIRQENEWLRKGKNPPVLVTDQHKQHIDEHAIMLSSPEALQNEKLVTAALQHIQEHIDKLRTADPALLNLLGQTPLPPLPPPMDPSAPAQPPPAGPAAPPAAPGHQMAPLKTPPPINGPGKLPEQPKMPINPLTHAPASPQDGAIRQ
jgi:hypothetical protein